MTERDGSSESESLVTREASRGAPNAGRNTMSAHDTSTTIDGDRAPDAALQWWKPNETPRDVGPLMPWQLCRCGSTVA
jgi:hypothetical protein